LNYRPANTTEELAGPGLFAGKSFDVVLSSKYIDPLCPRTAPRVTNDWPINWEKDVMPEYKELQAFQEYLKKALNPDRVPGKSFTQRLLAGEIAEDPNFGFPNSSRSNASGYSEASGLA
jgi:hypothetical protein